MYPRVERPVYYNPGDTGTKRRVITRNVLSYGSWEGALDLKAEPGIKVILLRFLSVPDLNQKQVPVITAKTKQIPPDTGAIRSIENPKTKMPTMLKIVITPTRKSARAGGA
jgi:hypothetical protein